jgi:hypothetical protein
MKAAMWQPLIIQIYSLPEKTKARVVCWLKEQAGSGCLFPESSDSVCDRKKSIQRSRFKFLFLPYNRIMGQVRWVTLRLRNLPL